MGEVQGTLFPLEFNRSVKLRSTREGLTADAGAVLLREVGERLGLWKLLDRALVDFLRLDPAFRLAVSKRRGESPLLAGRHGREPEGLASQATLSRLMAALGEGENRKALVEVLCAWAAHRAGLSRECPREEITVDLDSLPTEVHGHQPGSAYNGHYRCCCFHPLVVSWEFGDFLGGMLREGNVHTSTDALEFILPYLGWAAGFAKRVWLRMDAGFPSEPFLRALEKQGHRCVARLRANAGPEEEDGMELVGRYRQRGQPPPHRMPPGPAEPGPPLEPGNLPKVRPQGPGAGNMNAGLTSLWGVRGVSPGPAAAKLRQREIPPIQESWKLGSRDELPRLRFLELIRYVDQERDCPDR
jgi:hypothetical protein